MALSATCKLRVLVNSSSMLQVRAKCQRLAFANRPPWKAPGKAVLGVAAVPAHPAGSVGAHVVSQAPEIRRWRPCAATSARRAQQLLITIVSKLTVQQTQ